MVGPSVLSGVENGFSGANVFVRQSFRLMRKYYQSYRKRFSKKEMHTFRQLI